MTPRAPSSPVLASATASVPVGVAPARRFAFLLSLIFLVGMASAWVPTSGWAQAKRHDRREEAKPDSTSLRERLQSRSQSLFDEDLLTGNATFRDTSVARFDSLGLQTWSAQVDSRRKRLRFAYDPAFQLWTYQRVEGLVAAVGGSVSTTRQNRLKLLGRVGYATGSEKVRYYASADFLVRRGDSFHYLIVNYADRVRPFGSNRPTLNGVIAFTAGVDEQDYLRRQGGELRWWGYINSQYGLGFGYSEFEESSMPASTEFALFGKMDEPNPMITDGTDRALTARLRLRFFRRRFVFNIRHRAAGGGLGGDFTYNRTVTTLDWRFYAVGRHELATSFRGVNNTGTPTIQALGDIGGVSTVRGYDRRSFLGKHSFSGRAEWLVPYDLFKASNIPGLRSLRLQFVPWGDVGRVWEGNSDQWVGSAGLGIQKFLGTLGPASNFRADFAFPIGPDRPDDFRFYVQFTSAHI